MSSNLLLDIPALLHAYRNAPDWQVRIQNNMAAFVAFLHQHGLVRSGVLSSPDEEAGLFVLYTADLTDEGVQLFHRPILAVDKWLKANDNPTKPLSMRSLENGLKKIRAPQQPRLLPQSFTNP